MKILNFVDRHFISIILIGIIIIESIAFKMYFDQTIQLTNDYIEDAPSIREKEVRIEKVKNFIDWYDFQKNKK